jgi:hypothetical protein
VGNLKYYLRGPNCPLVGLSGGDDCYVSRSRTQVTMCVISLTTFPAPRRLRFEGELFA